MCLWTLTYTCHACQCLCIVIVSPQFMPPRYATVFLPPYSLVLSRNVIEYIFWWICFIIWLFSKAMDFLQWKSNSRQFDESDWIKDTKIILGYYGKTVAQSQNHNFSICSLYWLVFVFSVCICIANSTVCLFVSSGQLFSLTHAHVQIDYLSYGGWCVDSSVDRTHKCGQQQTQTWVNVCAAGSVHHLFENLQHKMDKLIWQHG